VVSSVQIPQTFPTDLRRHGYSDSMSRPPDCHKCCPLDPHFLHWLSTALVMDPFEEEEEEIDTASDVVKVECEDPATPGSLRRERARWHVGDLLCGCMLLGPPLRKPMNRSNSPIWLQ